jgi:hypothetical protein
MKKLLPLVVLISEISLGMVDNVNSTYAGIVKKWESYGELYERCKQELHQG